MKLKDVGDLLADIVPELAGASGFPLAEPFAEGIFSLLGLGEDSTREDVAKALANASEETILKIKEMEQTFILQMEKLGVDRSKINAADRKDARNRQVKISEIMGKRDDQPFYISLGVLAIAAGIAGGGIYLDVTEPNFEGLDAMLSMAGIKITAVTSYWIGSSRSSGKKDAMIAAMETPKGIV